MQSGLANRSQRHRAFTLVEMLVTAAVLVVILVLMMTMVSSISRFTDSGIRASATAIQARSAMETMNRILSESVLHSYWDYDTPNTPRHYLRASELHFVMGSAKELLPTGVATQGSAIFCQTPQGWSQQALLQDKNSLLNAVGFYLRYSELPDIPDLLADTRPESKAWRLWMVLEPSEELALYELYSGNPQAPSAADWYHNVMAKPQYHHVLANHVVLLLIRAGYENAQGEWEERYVYNSRGAAETSQYPQMPEIHQLPPTLALTMVVIDSKTADLLRAQSDGNAYYLFPPGDVFTDPKKYTEDLHALTSYLDGEPIGRVPIHYRIFETAVQVTSSKWSR